MTDTNPSDRWPFAAADPLFARVLEAPQADAPRRAIAAALRAAGDEDRSRFIEVQCALDALAAAPARSAVRAEVLRLKGEEKALLARRERGWLAELRRIGVTKVLHRRGFPDHLVFDAGHPWGGLAPTHLPLPAQTVRSVTLELAPGEAVPVGLIARAVGWGPGVEHLGLHGAGWRDTGARAVAELPGVENLRSLRLRDCGLGPDAVRAVVRSPHLRGLRDLDLSGNFLRGEGFAALAELPANLTALAHLNLSATRMRDAEAERLAGLSGLGGLAAIDIGDNRLSAAGVRLFLTAAHLSRVEILFDPTDLPEPDRWAVEEELDRHNARLCVRT